MTLVAPSVSSHHTVTFPHATSYHTHYHQVTAQPIATPMSIKLAPVSHAHSTATVGDRTESPTTPSSVGPGRYIGVIKTFYPERGYGWMACSRAGRDVFVHANDLQTPEARILLPFLPGTTLEFDIAQRPRGLSAVNVNVLSVPQPVYSVPEGQSENMRNRRHRTAADNFAPSRPIAMGRRFQGTVVYYTSCKGYGFVQTNNLAGKVYVHIYAVEKFNVTELRIGMVLEFSVRENHKGKYACNVKLLRDVPAEDWEVKAPVVAVTMWEGRYRGILKSFDTKRSLGWIQFRNTEVFMHIYEIRQDNAEDRLHLGVELEFNIGTHGRGPTAYDIDIIGTPSAATLRSIPLATLATIPVGSMGDSPQGSDDEERSTPPPEVYPSGPYSNPVNRSKLPHERRPAVSFQTVALLASLIEAAGIATAREDDPAYLPHGRQGVPRGSRVSATEDAQLAELLRLCMSSEPDVADDEGMRSVIEQMVRARLSQ